MITRECMMLLENSLTFTKQVTRKYDKQFAQSGAKIGATINLRLPAQFSVSSGPSLAVQNYIEQQVPLTIGSQKHVDVSFSSAELTLSIQDFSERVLAPQIVQLANQIDQDGLQMAALATSNSVGIPGTANTTLAQYLAAGVVLDNTATPRDITKRNIVLSAQGQADAVGGGFSTVFNDQDTVGKQYKNGTMGRAIGFKWSMDQNVYAQQNGPMGGAPVVNGAGQSGATLVTNGWTAAVASRLLGGEDFQVAGVFSVNPLSKVSTGKLKQISVLSAVSSDGAGNATLTLVEPLVTSGPTQNVTNSPAAGAAITFVGAANAITPVGLAFHEQAYTLACVDLEDVSQYGAWGARISDDQLGISMRIARQYAIGSDTVPCRVDVLYGWAAPRPSMATRIYGSNT
jgi:P22 coat protein - gene protein 5